MTYGEKIMYEQLEERPGLDLLARMIYAEAANQNEMGKRGVAFVARNRKDHAKSAEFGGTTYKEVISKKNAFESYGKSMFLAPDTNSTAWKDSLDIALNMDTKVNPISACLWFCTNSYYSTRSRVVNGQEQYDFGAGYKDIIEKKVLGDHTFFRVIGY